MCGHKITLIISEKRVNRVQSRQSLLRYATAEARADKAAFKLRQVLQQGSREIHHHRLIVVEQSVRLRNARWFYLASQKRGLAACLFMSRAVTPTEHTNH
jgi:hypothetical protein